MTLFYSPDEEVLRTARFAFGGALIATSNWRRVESRASGSSCLVVHLDPVADEVFEKFCMLKLRHPLLPAVLIAPRRAEVALAIRDIIIEELIWQDSLPTGLTEAVEKAMLRGLFNRIATEAKETHRLDAVVKDFVSAVLLSRRAISSLRQAAAMQRVDAKTLHNHWRKCVGRGTAFTPKDFIDWIVLLRASGLRNAGHSLKQIQNTVGVHQRTLDRICRRLTGMSLTKRYKPMRV